MQGEEFTSADSLLVETSAPFCSALVWFHLLVWCFWSKQHVCMCVHLCMWCMCYVYVCVFAYVCMWCVCICVCFQMYMCVCVYAYVCFSQALFSFTLAPPQTVRWFLLSAGCASITWLEPLCSFLWSYMNHRCPSGSLCRAQSGEKHSSLIFPFPPRNYAPVPSHHACPDSFHGAIRLRSLQMRSSVSFRFKNTPSLLLGT